MLPAAVSHTTQGMVGGVLPHVTAGILPDLIESESVPTSAITQQLVDINACVEDAIARIRPLLIEGTQTDRDLQQFEADLQGCLDDIRELRDDLDSFRAGDALLFDDAASLIQLWQWERDVRSNLVTTQLRILDSQAEIREVIDGRSEQVHIVRSGETWQSIAADRLGDWREWERIVAANGGEAGALVSGTLLVIPNKR